jgi:hypothetical protein
MKFCISYFQFDKVQKLTTDAKFGEYDYKLIEIFIQVFKPPFTQLEIPASYDHWRF